jgi:hypothetical protein
MKRPRDLRLDALIVLARDGRDGVLLAVVRKEAARA